MRINFLTQQRVFIFTFLLFLFSKSLFAQSESSGQIIKWKSINGVTSYKFELENSKGENLVTQNVEQNFYEIKMDVGVYRFRISALNKFNKIGKVYNWQTLEVKPVKPPVIKESPKIFNPKQSGNSIEIKGEYLHRGTNITLKSPSGKTIQAKKEVLPDGSGIKIIMPDNLEEGNYSINIQNSVGSPIEQKVELNSSLPTQISKNEIKSEEKDSNSENSFSNFNKSKYVVPMLWRSALVPGWGHEYANQRKIASLYFYSSLITGAYALNRLGVYNKNRNAYEEASQNYLYATLLGYNSTASTLLFEQDINSKYKSTFNTRNQYSYAAQAFSLIYIVSIVHAIIDGTKLEQSQSLQLNSVPEYYNNEMGTKYTVTYNFIY